MLLLILFTVPDVPVVIYGILILLKLIQEVLLFLYSTGHLLMVRCPILLILCIHQNALFTWFLILVLLLRQILFCFCLRSCFVFASDPELCLLQILLCFASDPALFKVSSCTYSASGNRGNAD